MGAGVEFYREIAIQWLADVTTLALVAGIPGMLALKFFARSVSLFYLWWICFYPLWSVFMVYGTVLFIAAWVGVFIPLTVDGVIAAVAFCCALWLTFRAFNVGRRPPGVR